MNDPLHSPHDFGLYVVVALGLAGITISLFVLALAISYLLKCD